ncbi:MAG: ankyrin repeat domain-containing protein [Candidatus Eremiobacteraeota bacterium]|nr:ankyrin repeat domain-containing protein [Candidatus Eremiobacteraeota bacterium]
MSVTNFWQAVLAADLPTLRSLLQQEPGLVNQTYEGEARNLEPAPTGFTNTALHYAVLHGQREVVECLLEAGADINAIGFEPGRGLTPALVLAVAEADLEMVKLLCARGADVNQPASAETPLFTAIEEGFQDKVEVLLAHGARHDVFTAAITGQTDLVVRHLEAYPSLLKARDLKRNRTPWEEAAAHSQDDVMDAIRVWTDRLKAEAPKTPAQTGQGWGGGDEEEVFWGGEETPEPVLEAAPEATPAEAPPATESEPAWDDWVGEGSNWPG